LSDRSTSTRRPFARRTAASASAASPRTRAGEQQPAEGWEDLAARLAAETAARQPG
jgi:hypothetical protein